MKIKVYSIRKHNGRIIRKIEQINDSLEEMQFFVGGYIEKIPLIPEKNIVILCDEEAGLKGSEVTSCWEIFVNGLYKTDLEIKGNHLICKVGRRGFIGLTDEDIKTIKQIEKRKQ